MQEAQAIRKRHAREPGNHKIDMQEAQAIKKETCKRPRQS